MCMLRILTFCSWHAVPKSFNWLEMILPVYDTRRFKSFIGIRRDTFNDLVALIESHSVFHDIRELPVTIQVAMVLYRIRLYGSGATETKIAALFGIGDGSTILRVTKRVFAAFLDTPQLKIRWPNRQNRQRLLKKTRNELPGCVAIIDGTHTILKIKPRVNPVHFFNYKQNYSLKTQIVCDVEKRVIHLATGYQGSVHDARVFRSCELFSNPQRYFNGNQFMAGDSAYPLSPTCLTPYKSNNPTISSDDRRRFNKRFSKIRVRVENCIGEIKKQFPSVHELRKNISTDEDIKFCSDWIAVCCMLHNFTLDYPDYDSYIVDNDYAADEDDDEEEEDEEPLPLPVGGEERRQMLFDDLFG